MVSDSSAGGSSRARREFAPVRGDGGARGAKGRDRDAGAAASDGAPAPADGVAVEQLLQRYRLRRSRALLDQVVERQRCLVEAMAYSLASRLPRSVDVQDLVHAGMWGLMQAIAVYEPERCDTFQAFMRIRVRGAMLDELRNMDVLPRLFRRRVRERDAARARLRMELEREPTSSELAQALGISEQELLRCPEEATLRTGRHVDDSEDDGDSDFAHLADDAIESPIEAITRQELIEMIRRHLEPVEWRVLQLHYLEGLTGKQVAKRLRLSASRICQIHGKVLERLKQQLTPTTV
jgi:RNA polymerase sigma factor FliA